MAVSVLNMEPQSDEEVPVLGYLQEMVRCALPNQSARVDLLAVQVLELYRARSGTVEILKEQAVATEAGNEPIGSE